MSEGTEPMSEERRAEIRHSVETFRRWTMRDPVNRAVIELHDELERSEAEVERLRAWKDEAMAVHAEWEETWQAAGRPGRLGMSKAVGVREEVARSRAAIDRVIDLHVKGTVSIIASDSSLTDRVTCLTCTGIDEGDALPPNEVYEWPCPTIRAVAAREQTAPPRPKCLHCQRPMRSDDGRFWVHTDGGYRGKGRCDPNDSALPYGYNGHPDASTGEQVGCLCRGEQTEGDR